MSAICESQYFESVLSIRTSTHTDYEGTNGVVIASSDLYRDCNPPQEKSKAFYAFDKSINKQGSGCVWHASGYTKSPKYTQEWIGYNFNIPQKIHKIGFYVAGSTYYAPKNFKVQVSDNGTEWIDIFSTIASQNDYDTYITGNTSTAVLKYNKDIIVNKEKSYKYYRILINSTLSDDGTLITALSEIYFYGREATSLR